MLCYSKIYNISIPFAAIKYSHYSAPLLMRFDRRRLISFMAIVLMTQTYKRLQKLKWLIFLCLTNTNPLQ